MLTFLNQLLQCDGVMYVDLSTGLHDWKGFVGFEVLGVDCKVVVAFLSEFRQFTGHIPLCQGL